MIGLSLCLLFTQVLSYVSALSVCPLPAIPHGKVKQTPSAQRASSAEIVCDSGYKLSHSTSITCRDNGEWVATYGRPDIPQCIVSGKCGLPIIPHGKVLNPSSDSSHGSGAWTETQVVCNEGFKLNGTPFIMCKDGSWSTAYGSQESFPVCVRKTCLPISTIENAKVESSWRSLKVTIRCKSGYVMDIHSPAVLTCVDGQWVGEVPTCVLVKSCFQPPEIPFANVQYYKENPVEGSKVTYHCSSGYTMDDPSLAQLTCINGEWPGKLPTCMLTIRCDTPERIPKGHWTRVGGSDPYKYEVNTKIQYECNPGFRALGESLMWCQEDKSWSHIPPQCIPEAEFSIYCDSPPNLRHGECTCEGHDKNYCAPFTPGMRWLCHCGDGYNLEGVQALTCTSNGEWNHDMPTCIPVDTQISTDDTTSTPGSHISTLAIVVATACSVLGVLLLVMVAVIFRRHKPRPRLYHPTPAPPPYTRVHSNSVDEHDRVALIAYAEGRQITLPTYEEVTRGPRSMATTTHATSGVTNGNEAGLQQYRPLPPVPPILRGTAPPNHSTTDNNNRHSTATTSTVHNRDGISEVFGSLDTVNVSISDASTAGTMETVDSGASNPSLASRRANAGSLGSSNGSLANDDAPLLESSHDGRIMSTSSEPLPEEDKEE